MVSIGAGKFPLGFGAPEIRDLGAKLSRLGGSRIAVASPRTRYDVLDILAKHVENCSAKFYSWSHGANLYRAACLLADQIVVTSDSMSMVSDAINSGKPVSIFRLPVSGLFPSWSAKSGFAAWLSRQGLLQAPRNMTAVINSLVARGYGIPLGGEPIMHSVLKPNYQVAIDQIRDLFVLET